MNFFNFLNENGKLNKCKAEIVNLKVNGSSSFCHCERRKARNNPGRSGVTPNSYALRAQNDADKQRLRADRPVCFADTHPKEGKRRGMGFTLAEVLITLVIIGIIGALTVPSLIQRTQKQEYVSALKKAYSTLSQATNEIIAEEGSPKSSCETCNDGWAYDVDSIYNLYKSKLNILKDCGTEAGCFSSGVYKKIDGMSTGNAFNSNSGAEKFIAADGASILIEWYSSVCSSRYTGDENFCAHFVVDINGVKEPNKFGRDVFWFVLKENGLFPRGCGYDNFCTSEGIACACKVLREGAMNY